MLSITIAPPRAMKSPVGRLVDVAQGSASRVRSAAPRSRCSRQPRRGPGSASRWRRRRRPAGRRQREPRWRRPAPRSSRSRVRSSAIVPPGRATSSTGARSTLTPAPRRFAAVARPWLRLNAAPAAPICIAEAAGGPPMRFTCPPSWSAITSNGARSPGGRRIACSRRIKSLARQRGWGGSPRRGSRRPVRRGGSSAPPPWAAAVPSKPATMRCPASPASGSLRGALGGGPERSLSSTPKAKAAIARPHPAPIAIRLRLVLAAATVADVMSGSSAGRPRPAVRTAA